MLFMTIERFRNQDAKAVYRRFREKGRKIRGNLCPVRGWVAADLIRSNIDAPRAPHEPSREKPDEGSSGGGGQAHRKRDDDFEGP